MNVFKERNKRNLYYEEAERCSTKNVNQLEKDLLWERQMNKYRNLYSNGKSIEGIGEILRQEDNWNRIFIIKQLKKEIENGKI